MHAAPSDFLITHNLRNEAGKTHSYERTGNKKSVRLVRLVRPCTDCFRTGIICWRTCFAAVQPPREALVVPQIMQSSVAQSDHESRWLAVPEFLVNQVLKGLVDELHILREQCKP